MRFTVVSLGIIAAVMISSSCALGGDALDITGKGREGVKKLTGGLATVQAPVSEIGDKASSAKDVVSSEAKNGASEAKIASSASRTSIGDKARGNLAARRSFLVRRNLGRAVYKRHTTSNRLSRGDRKYKHDEDEDENNKNKSLKDYQDSITRRRSV